MNIFLTQKEAADYLSISQTSIKNWIRHGYIKVLDMKIKKDELDLLNKQILTGEIDLLNKRANKSASKKQFIPDEYIANIESKDTIISLIQKIENIGIGIDTAIYILSLNLLLNRHELKRKNDNVTRNNLNPDNYIFKRKSVKQLLKKQYSAIISNEHNIDEIHIIFLLNFFLPNEQDILGILYQSLLNENRKAELGSYYTPKKIVDMIVPASIDKNSKILDPCCGTGQFLIAAAKVISNPLHIYGTDIDEAAVYIASINLLLLFQDIDFSPNIFICNFLDSDQLKTVVGDKLFDYILTNPPWGAKQKKISLENYEGKESFSLFIA